MRLSLIQEIDHDKEAKITMKVQKCARDSGCVHFNLSSLCILHSFTFSEKEVVKKSVGEVSLRLLQGQSRMHADFILEVVATLMVLLGWSVT